MSKISRVAYALRLYNAPRGRGNKLYGFRKTIPFDFLLDLDLILSRYRSLSSSSSDLVELLDEIDSILPFPDEQK